MATMQAALKTLLESDASLIALATGGVWDWEETGRNGLKIEDIREAGSSPKIKPAILIKWSTLAPQGDEATQALAAFVEIFFYQQSGYVTIQQMRSRVYTLLHHKRYSFDDPAGWWMHRMQWAGDVENQTEEDLGGAPMERSRYLLDIVRS